ncbi:tetratricopeptide repeat protein [candidate division TA06 bacterium]|uniref:Tetratricopeptide repeat protein n=1 Tax=candidate division TA06 bacterium TaxID=2250710 RepID=A0A933IGA4_UNCT6|nr:tetratricopeptide repeat protein [candidate division TA06 bacterium]
MNKCPFITFKQVVKKLKYDADDKLLEEKEHPLSELRDCLGAECEIFDAEAQKCSLPVINKKMRKPDELSEEAGKTGSVVAELKEIKENTAATLLHILKKTDATNEAIDRLAEAVKNSLSAKGGEGQALDLSELKQPLSQISEKLADLPEADLSQVHQLLAGLTEELKISQSKFSDILELTLEDQQKRAAQEAQQAQDGDKLGAKLDAIKEALAGRQENGQTEEQLAAIKEALTQSQEKFSSILELMLEDTQRQSEQNLSLTQMLSGLVRGQQELKEQQVSLAEKSLTEQSAHAGKLVLALEQMVSGIKTLAESKPGDNLEAVEQRLAQAQEALLAVLEAQRNEQRQAGNERRLRQAEENNDRGVMLYYRRELSGAEAQFKKAIDIRPDFYEAFNNLGLALSDQGRREEAVAAFKKAVELSPEAPEAYNNLGCLYKGKKDYQQAVEYFNQAIARQADYSLAYLNLGTAYEEMEKFDLAIKSWEKVLAVQPTNDEARRKVSIYRAKRT